MGLHITNHAKQRTKNRVGLSKNIANKNAEKAMELGLTHKDVAGNLCRYIDKLYLSHRNCNNIRIYNQYVYMFQDNTLITIILLPSHFHKLANKLQKEKNNKIT
jgi:hypothetical protein